MSDTFDNPDSLLEPSPPKAKKPGDLVIPTSTPAEEKDVGKLLEEHKGALILDHPDGSVQMKHIEIRLRQIIEMHISRGYMEVYQGQVYHYAAYAP